MDERQEALLAKSKNDPYAAMKLLRSSLEALAKVIAGKALTNADLYTIDYLRTGLHNYLINGLDFESAMKLERVKGGRPRLTTLKKLEIYDWISLVTIYA
jgi:hypothetical protein